MRVSVTADDIAKGQRFKLCECPVALAVKRAFNLDAVVGYSDLSLKDGSVYAIPLIASQFILRFDLGTPVAPFEFDL